MDPVSAAGLAIGVAGIALQVYTACVQGIQLVITAKNFPEECQYLNIRLRMEQQRLFAWSETSGLHNVGGKDEQKILESNTFILHRTTVLDLLVQIQYLFKEFQDYQKQYKRLEVSNESDQTLEHPEKDAEDANFPLPQRRRDFIRRAMGSLRDKSLEGARRLRWATFDKEGFERLLSKFSQLNDNMMDILDARLQAEIHHTVQDTNRGVLQLHHKVADLSRLVMALNIKLESSQSHSALPLSGIQKGVRAADALGLKHLTQLAKFKAFNETIESDKPKALDETTARSLELSNLPQPKDLELDPATIEITPGTDEYDQRSEGILRLVDGSQKQVWIEWKEYDQQSPADTMPPKQVILERVRKLAALLNHSPKPEAFRTPHCLGFFDRAARKTRLDDAASNENDDEDDDDISNQRLGLVFDRPGGDGVAPGTPPVSLRQLLDRDPNIYQRPSLTDRVKLAHAISNCLLSLHLANWLHKSLRSDNIIFFANTDGRVDYSKPYLSGFDFSRPVKKEEMTELAGDDLEHDLYRHPLAQTSRQAVDRTRERERFRKSFDVYSLGVVLVEIAHWSPVEKVLGIDMGKARGRPSMTVAKVQDRLLAPKTLAELAAHMGRVYGGAAHRCIAGGEALDLLPADDETDDRVAAKMSMTFYEEVVNKLQSIVV